MEIKELLRPENIRINVPAKDKTKFTVIDEMMDILVKGHDLTEMQRESLTECIVYRERQKSTGMERRVALPHGQSEQCPNLFMALAIYPAGVPFESIDGIPAQFIFCVVRAYRFSTPGIQILSQMMRILQRENVQADILESTTTQQVCDIVIRESKPLNRM